VTGSPLAAAVVTAGAVVPARSSEVSMVLQMASGKDHYHNRSRGSSTAPEPFPCGTQGLNDRSYAVARR
jgi:hypothetical protein